MRRVLVALLRSRTARPFLVAAAIVICIGVADGGNGRFLTIGTASSIFQQFASIGPVALAVGLTMILREFDLSVGGMTGLAGCIAVIAGGGNPLTGIAAAIAVGAVAGLVQGFIMTRLALSSVAVTLGGLLTLSGIAYVITGNATIGYPRLDIALFVNEPLIGILSVRGIAALAMFAIAALVMAFTRLGRDVVAVGSDRRSAMVAGVSVPAMIMGVFAVSGMLTAAGGALLSFSMAAASPAALANTLIPAVAAAIIGGVSLSGGKGTPLGIAGGVLVLCILRASMSSIGLVPYVQDVVTGGVLLLVSFADAENLSRRIFALRTWARGTRRGPVKTNR